MGIELVGTTAAETKDPEKSLPRAINSIPIRIIMFYVFADCDYVRDAVEFGSPGEKPVR